MKRLLPFLMALVAILIMDRALLGPSGPWERIDALITDCGAPCRVIRNKTFAERQLADLRGADPERWRVAIVGSSRVGAGFIPQALPKSDPALATLHLAKAPIAASEPYTMLGLAFRVDSEQVDEVVLYLSEFDTHRPLYLVPAVGYGSLAAWFELLRVGGPYFAWRYSEDLVRLGLSAALNTYRHRDVLQAIAWANALTPRIVRDDDRDDLIVSGEFKNALAMRVPDERMLGPDAFQTASDEIRTLFPGPIPTGPFNQIRTIVGGEHVAIQKALVRATVDALVAKEIRVLIVEAPIHPAGDRLFDVAHRDDFRSFAQRLANLDRVEFLSLDAMPAFTMNEFGDLTHLNKTGGARLTRTIVDHLATRRESEGSKSEGRTKR